MKHTIAGDNAKMGLLDNRVEILQILTSFQHHQSQPASLCSYEPILLGSRGVALQILGPMKYE
jgi:hypothetical protein